MSSYYDLEGELKNIINESKAVRNDMSDMRRHQKFMDQSIEEKTTYATPYRLGQTDTMMKSLNISDDYAGSRGLGNTGNSRLN